MNAISPFSVISRWFFGAFLAFLFLISGAQAALFEDDEARKAILELRQRVETLRGDVELYQRVIKDLKDENVGLGKGLLDLQRQLELLRSDNSSLRGNMEQFRKDISDFQRQNKDQFQGFNERLVGLEPIKVTLDGVEFSVEPSEKREYETALAVFRKSDFLAAQNLLVSFLGRYAGSGYAISALFWLGNAQYATRDYKEAMINFRALLSRAPSHSRAPEAVLSVANCQLELKDAKGARKTLTDLIKAYPQSEAAGAARERLATLK
jgi:tol-pal system protein YbgF